MIEQFENSAFPIVGSMSPVHRPDVTLAAAHVTRPEYRTRATQEHSTVTILETVTRHSFCQGHFAFGSAVFTDS